MGSGSSKSATQYGSLCEATKAADAKAVQWWLQTQHADPNGKVLTSDGWTNPLFIAVDLNLIDIVQTLLKAGANPDHAYNDEKITPLMKAVWRANDKCVRLLLKHGAVVGAADMDGDTALHYAAVKNSPDCMRVLLAGKAAVNARNAKQQTPLHQACHVGALECVKLLVQKGADLTLTDKVGLTPAELAALKDQKAVLDYLVPLLEGKQ
jgi:ankyrin repeat protein